MYSNYQRVKNNLSSRYYNKVDVLIEIEKRNKILNKYSSYGDRLKKLAYKKLIQINQNIEFICRMLNQQIIENYKTK